MKFTEFIKDYVKKHPGVKYKDAIKDKKVRCLWHDHRGKEIGCPSSCPPVPQEKLQLNTLPRPASYEPQQPIRTSQYTPPARQPPILAPTRNNATRQRVEVDADGFAVSQVANAINRRYQTRVPEGPSFLSGLANTIGAEIASALEGIRDALPGDTPILGVPQQNDVSQNNVFFSNVYRDPPESEFLTIENPDRNISVQRARERFDPEERETLSEMYLIGQRAMLGVVQAIADQERQDKKRKLTEVQYVDNVVNTINNIMYGVDIKERSQFVRGANTVFKEQMPGNLRLQLSTGEVYYGSGLSKKKSRKYI